MAVILKNGAVFLHIPKTGGNWVIDALTREGLVAQHVGYKHADINHYFARPPLSGRKAILGRLVSDMLSFPKPKPFLFSFVRHPLSWYESWFKYMSQPKRNWKTYGDEHSHLRWHPNEMLNGVGSSDFSQFIRNVIEKRPGYVTELFGWYTTPEIDFVGKQESLAEDLITVLSKMDLRFDPDRIRSYVPVGVSPKPQADIIWDAELKAEMNRIEYAGILRYGYDSRS